MPLATVYNWQDIDLAWGVVTSRSLPLVQLPAGGRLSACARTVSRPDLLHQPAI